MPVGPRTWLASMVVLGACNRPAPTDEGDAATARIMQPVSADVAQVLPDVLAGFTACTVDGFAHRIDAETAASRTAAWKREAAMIRPTLHAADVLAVAGPRDYSRFPAEERPEGIVHFRVPRGDLELRFPGRMSIRTARRAAQPKYARPDTSAAFLVAPLGEAPRVMIGDFWNHSGSGGGTAPSFDVDVFLVKESVDDTVASLRSHLQRALPATVCAVAEGPGRRSAYRLASERRLDGSVELSFAESGSTADCHYGVSERLVIARRVADVTLVLLCNLDGVGADTLCRTSASSARLR